ncbi:MAG: hypothetical protein ITG02_15480 [Patulibacter sp.]|nr:hypothetical protein [Patulibacter sp.]
MTNEQLTLLVGGISGLIALFAVVLLVFIPVVRIYATWWQRTAAVVLASVVVGGFLLGGVYGGLVVVDKFLS